MTEKDQESNRRKYMYRTTLRELYGLTDTMLRELGEPDLEVPNPHYRSGPPASLYLIARVELWIEQNADRVQKARERRQKRSARMTAVAQERSAKLLAWARAVPIVVAPLPGLGALQRQVEESFLDFALERGRAIDFNMSPNAIVAYVRHNLSNYEELLDQIKGQVGVDTAYLTIRERCDRAIRAALEQKAGWSALLRDHVSRLDRTC